ncbi:MAG: lysophospholipid acyltransferase family protein [Acidimicrobiales bacterium]
MSQGTREHEIDLTDHTSAANGGSGHPDSAESGPLPVEDEIKVGQLYTIARAVIRPTLKLFWRIRVEGLEHVPTEGPAIIAPNHSAAIDSFFVPCVLPRRITYVGKAEYLDDWKTAKLFPAMGMIPLDRSGGSASERALNTAARVLDRGELFGIYPEGTRSRTGKLHKGHTGVARLALRCNAPIVPVGLIGTREVQPPDVKVPRPFRTVTVRFGTPIDVTRYRERAHDRFVLRQITDEVMFEIRALTGLAYDPTYATRSGTEAEPTKLDSDELTIPRRSSAELLSGASGPA